MAPKKLTDLCLESVLWNKVLVELQQEVKEITTDGSVHELLQKLLRAETIIQEHASREKTKGNESNLGNISSRGSNCRRGANLSTELPHKPTENKNNSRRTDAEMSIRGIKCFISKQKAHMAKSSPKARKNPARIVVLDSSESTTDAGKQQPVDVDKLDPWMRTVTAEKENNEPAADTRGPSYKVNIVVEG